MKKFFFLLIIGCMSSMLLAQTITGGTATNSISKSNANSPVLYGMPLIFVVDCDISSVTGAETPGVGGYCVPIGYDAAKFFFHNAENVDLPGNEGSTPPSLVFVHTDSTIAATNGWFSGVAATSVTTQTGNCTLFKFVGRPMFIGNINLDMNPSGLASQNQMSLSSKWTSSNGGPDTITSNPTDLLITNYGLLIGPKFDVNNDGLSEVSFFRPKSTAQFYVHGTGYINWGTTDDYPVHGDFDGDNNTDVGVYRPSLGKWIIKKSSDGTTMNFYNGTATDIPAPGDYNGDGLTDFCVIRPLTTGPATGQYKWIIFYNGGGSTNVYEGLAGDIPVPADYDGDGTTDTVIYRPTAGVTGTLGRWMGDLSNGGRLNQYHGLTTDVPFPADLNGDGSADLGLYRRNVNSTIYSQWRIMRTSDWSLKTKWRGLADDIPAPADYTGDGSMDLGCVRKNTNGQLKWLFYDYNPSTQDFDQPTRKLWVGLNDDVPVSK